MCTVAWQSRNQKPTIRPQKPTKKLLGAREPGLEVGNVVGAARRRPELAAPRCRPAPGRALPGGARGGPAPQRYEMHASYARVFCTCQRVGGIPPVCWATLAPTRTALVQSLDGCCAAVRPPCPVARLQCVQAPSTCARRVVPRTPTRSGAYISTRHTPGDDEVC